MAARAAYWQGRTEAGMWHAAEASQLGNAPAWGWHQGTVHWAAQASEAGRAAGHGPLTPKRIPGVCHPALPAGGAHLLRSCRVAVDLPVRRHLHSWCTKGLSMQGKVAMRGSEDLGTAGGLQRGDVAWCSWVQRGVGWWGVEQAGAKGRDMQGKRRLPAAWPAALRVRASQPRLCRVQQGPPHPTARSTGCCR